MWLVAIHNNQIGQPFKSSRFPTMEAVQAASLYPCNYGDYDPAVNYIDGVTVVGDKVEYDLMPITAEMELNRLKTLKVADIIQNFEQLLLAGYTCTNNVKMDAPLDKLLPLQVGFDLATRLGQTSMYIVDYDNNFHSGVPITTVYDMLIELGGNLTTLHEKKNTLRSRIMAATTAEEVELIA